MGKKAHEFVVGNPENKQSRKQVLGKNSEKKFSKLPFATYVKAAIDESQAWASEKKLTYNEAHEAGEYAIDLCANQGMVAGVYMEQLLSELTGVRDELEEAKKTVQNLTNDIGTIGQLLEPELLKMIKNIRDHRQTISVELKKSLEIMKEVREFLLDKEHAEEMEKFKELVGWAAKLKKYSEDGTLDALVDTALKLAVGKDKNKQKQTTMHIGSLKPKE